MQEFYVGPAVISAIGALCGSGHRGSDHRKALLKAERARRKAARQRARVSRRRNRQCL